MGQGTCKLTPESLPVRSRRCAAAAQCLVESQQAAATMGRCPRTHRMTPAPDGLLEAFTAFCGDDRQIWQSDGSLLRQEPSAAVGIPSLQVSSTTPKDIGSSNKSPHHPPSMIGRCPKAMRMVEFGGRGVDVDLIARHGRRQARARGPSTLDSLGWGRVLCAVQALTPCKLARQSHIGSATNTVRIAARTAGAPLVLSGELQWRDHGVIME